MLIKPLNNAEVAMMAAVATEGVEVEVAAVTDLVLQEDSWRNHGTHPSSVTDLLCSQAGTLMKDSRLNSLIRQMEIIVSLCFNGHTSHR